MGFVRCLPGFSAAYAYAVRHSSRGDVSIATRQASVERGMASLPRIVAAYGF